MAEQNSGLSRRILLPPKRVVEGLPEKLRAMATRGHQVRAADVASLVQAAQAIEAQRATLDHDMRMYANLIGDLVETRTQLLSLRELMQAGLDGKEDV
jgi:hypothetical protein